MSWIFVKQNKLTLSYVGAVGSAVQQSTSGTRSYSIAHTCDSAATYLIVTGNQSSAASYNALTGCTVNSETATLASQFGAATSQSTAIDRLSIAMYTVSGITGASLSIDTTWTGGNVFRSTVQVYKLDDASISVHDTATDSGVGADSTGSVSIDVPASGVVVAMACSSATASSPTWGSTLTLDNTIIADTYIQSMCGSKTGGGTGYAITGTSLTNGVTGEAFRLLAVSFS